MPKVSTKAEILTLADADIISIAQGGTADRKFSIATLKALISSLNPTPNAAGITASPPTGLSATNVQDILNAIQAEFLGLDAIPTLSGIQSALFGNITYFNQSSSPYQIDPLTGVLLMDGDDAGGDITVLLPDVGSFPFERLYIFFRNMAGHNAIVSDATFSNGGPNQNGDLTLTGNYCYVVLQPSSTGDGYGQTWFIAGRSSVSSDGVESVVPGTETGAVRANVSIDPTDPANPIISVSPAMEHNWTCVNPITRPSPIAGSYTPVDLLADNTLGGRCIIRQANLFYGKKFVIETSFYADSPGKDAFFIAIGTDVYGDFDVHNPTFDIGGNGLAPTDASGSSPSRINDLDLFLLRITMTCVTFGDNNTFTYRPELWNITQGTSIPVVDNISYAQIVLAATDQIIYANLGLENCGDSIATISVQQVDGWQESSNGLVADQEG